MQELISRLVDSAGIQPELAEKAIGIILNFLSKEAPSEPVEELLNSIPGARDAAAAQSGEGSLIAGFADIGGMGAMGALNQLTQAGLSMNEVQIVTRQVIDYAREKVGDETLGQIVGAIPGLEAFV
jgi:hypothetical protein